MKKRKSQVLFPVTPVMDGNLEGEEKIGRDIIMEGGTATLEGEEKIKEEEREEKEKKKREKVGGFGGETGGLVITLHNNTIRYPCWRSLQDIHILHTHIDMQY